MALLPLSLVVELRVDGTWVDITRDVYTREDIAIVRGRPDEGDEVDPGKCSLVLNNRQGKYSPRNPRSPYYRRIGRNTPIRVGVNTPNGLVWRFHGEVASWPPRWDVSDTDVWVPIEAAGILRRLEQQGAPLQTALRRLYERYDPVAYWVLDDAEAAGARGASAVPGGSAIRWALWDTTTFTAVATPPDWEQDPPGEWMDRMVATVGTRGIATGAVPGRSATWVVDQIRAGRGGQDAIAITTRTPSGATETWFLGEDPTVNPRELNLSVQYTVEEQSSSSALLGTVEATGLVDGSAHHVRLSVTREGSGSRYAVIVDGVEVIGGTRPVHPGVVSSWGYHWWWADDGVSDHIRLGHVAVWGPNAPDAAAATAALRGHAGEPAAERILRLADEEGLPMTVVGDVADTVAVGPQYPDDAVSLIREAAAVDGGILYEARDQFGLAYRTLRSMYNRGAQLSE
ncbi:hypothetical protein [Nocardiopsis lucentensis]|uniref:hypothetical protein n=1 Tax=Nocardiopsis lucentensis TaxID=53441 RepID=UPI00034ABEA7|nr:hypothetical protein [Nocardiopsis lucentensis]